MPGAAAQRILGTPTATETIEAALDLVVFRDDLVAGRADPTPGTVRVRRTLALAAPLRRPEPEAAQRPVLLDREVFAGDSVLLPVGVPLQVKLSDPRSPSGLVGCDPPSGEPRITT